MKKEIKLDQWGKPCGCVYCSNIRPIPEKEYRNCGACGQCIYWNWDEAPHSWRNFDGHLIHDCGLGYSHGKRLGKNWCS